MPCLSRTGSGTVLAALAILAHSNAGAQVSGTLVVTNKSPSTATIIDIAGNRILAALPTGAGPHEVAITRDGRWAVVTDYGGAPRKTLTVIDVPGLRVARTIDLGEYTAPHGIMFLPGDSLVAVTSEATRNVVLVNVHDGVVRRAISTGQPGSHMVAVTTDGTRAYTGDIGANTVSELDLRTGEVSRRFEVPAQPEALNVTPDGGEVWVGSNATGVVSVVDLATGKVTPGVEGFGWPYRVLFSPDGRIVLLPDLRGNALRFVDRASRRELGRLEFPDGGPQGITLTPDGRYAFQSLSREGRVAMVDVAARSVVGYLEAGETPDGVAYAARHAPHPPSHDPSHHPAPSALEQIREVEAAIRPFRELDSARTAGFSPVLGWLPTMGTHFVSPARMLVGRPASRADVSQLMFSPMGGRETLVGAAFAYLAPTADSTRPPSLFEGDPPWHDHPDLAPPGTNLLMLHVWFVPSPDGPFAGHNPWLPFWALGLEPPDQHHLHDPALGPRIRKAALALGELVDSTGIFPRAARRLPVREVLERERAAMRPLVPELGAALRSGERRRWEPLVDRLAERWDVLEAAYLESAVSPNARTRMVAFIASMLGGGHHHGQH